MTRSAKPSLPLVAAAISGAMILSACATDDGSVQVQRYQDEKSEFTLDVENAGEGHDPGLHDCGTFAKRARQGFIGNAHAIATCARNRARLGRPFRMHVCAS